MHGSDYADMSNEKWGENPHRRNSKVSRGRFVRPGLVGPKARPKGVVEGQRVNIPVLPVRVRAMESAGGWPRDLMDGRPSP